MLPDQKNSCFLLTLNYNYLMKSKKIWTLLLFVGCSFSCLFAQKKAVEKWVSLFNGKDLKGWKHLNGKATYQVKNGEIIGVLPC
jgi:hypothetical protein